LNKVNELYNFHKLTGNKAILNYSKEDCDANVIIAVAQYMIGKCKSIIDVAKDNSKEILVELTSEKRNIEDLICEFNEQVDNYSFYNDMMKERGQLRELILERVLQIAKEQKNNEANKL
jgi:hypothetical protein